VYQRRLVQWSLNQPGCKNFCSQLIKIHQNIKETKLDLLKNWFFLLLWNMEPLVLFYRNNILMICCVLLNITSKISLKKDTCMFCNKLEIEKSRTWHFSYKSLLRYKIKNMKFFWILCLAGLDLVMMATINSLNEVTYRNEVSYECLDKSYKFNTPTTTDCLLQCRRRNLKTFYQQNMCFCVNQSCKSNMVPNSGMIAFIKSKNYKKWAEYMLGKKVFAEETFAVGSF